MILRDRSIRDAIEEGIIVCNPTPDWRRQLQPASLDLTLGDEFSIYDPKKVPTDLDISFMVHNGVMPGIKPGNTDVQGLMTTMVFEKGKPFIEPGQFMLTTTAESIGVPNDMVARVEGRSTMARMGLAVHITAGFIDPGFEGQITLEMVNFGQHRIWLYPGMRICQICFEKLDAPAENPYRGKYWRQQGVTASRTHLDEPPEE